MKNKKVFFVIICVLLILGSISLYMILTKDDKINNNDNNNKTTTTTTTTSKKLSIVDENSKTRPYAVMINNHSTARKYHAGLQDAYIVYEFIVEGGITRFLALFRDVNVEKIGSVRSARHYFLDYALENDAIYVHWGWSPQAESDIKKLKINNINGLTYEGTYFYRDKELKKLKVSTEHTGFTNTEMLDTAAKKLKYNRDMNKELLLNYSVDDINLNNRENAIIANNVEIKYSNGFKSSYVYDKENMVYKRFVNDKEHTDYGTKKQYTFKNIITYQVKNYTIKGDTSGRQEFENIGSGTGYYITNGYAVKINWKKESRSSQTKYTYEDGTEINVNDGNTFIQIQPMNQELTIS